MKLLWLYLSVTFYYLFTAFNVTLVFAQSANLAPQSNEPTPSVVIEPSSGPAGTAVTVQGSNFTPGGYGKIRVSILFDGERLTELSADQSGQFQTQITIPSNAPPGQHKILAYQYPFPRNGSANFHVVAMDSVRPLGVSLTPDVQSGNEQLTVNFRAEINGGTAPYAWVLEYGDGQQTSGSESSFSIQHNYVLPMEGRATLLVKDNAGQTTSAEVPITVTAPRFSITVQNDKDEYATADSISAFGSILPKAPPGTIVYLIVYDSQRQPIGTAEAFIDEESNYIHVFSGLKYSGAGMYHLIATSNIYDQRFSSTSHFAIHFDEVPLSPAVFLEPGSGPAGTPITVLGMNFGAGRDETHAIDILFDQSPLAQVSANQSGDFRVEITIPTDAAIGQHIVIGQQSGISQRGSANFIVTGSLAEKTLTVNLTSDVQSGDAELVVNILAEITGGIPPYTWVLDYGDGQQIRGRESSLSVHHEYLTPGVGRAILNVRDDAGQVSSAELPITVNAPTFSITIQTDRDQYLLGDSISVHGSLNPKKAPPGTSIQLRVEDSKKQIIELAQIFPDKQGNYEHVFSGLKDSGAGTYYAIATMDAYGQNVSSLSHFTLKDTWNPIIIFLVLIVTTLTIYGTAQVLRHPVRKIRPPQQIGIESRGGISTSTESSNDLFEIRITSRGGIGGL